MLLVSLYAVVASISAVLVTSGGFGPQTAPMAWQQQALWILGLSVPLIWRRRYPASSVIVISVIFIAAQLAGFVDNFSASVALFWGMYSVGAWSRNRKVAFWVRFGIVTSMFGAILVNYLRARDQLLASELPAFGPLDPVLASVIYNLLLNVGYFAASSFFGTAAWTSARRQHVLAEQAAALAAAQEINSQRAVMRERVHIARELHDVVAHHVSVMGVQASAARRVLGKSPELASDALKSVETTARVAITELRSLLGVLRDAGAVEEGRPSADTFHAAPGVDQIPELIRQTESAGLRITYGVFGEERPVPIGVSLSIFRIVQEALTNVIKHAGADRVDVRLRYLESSIEVEITDDGAAAPNRDAAGGFGLIGMRERATVHGGDLVVGPRTTGGYRVRAVLPLAESAPDSRSADADIAADAGIVNA